MLDPSRLNLALALFIVPSHDDWGPHGPAVLHWLQENRMFPWEESWPDG